MLYRLYFVFANSVEYSYNKLYIFFRHNKFSINLIMYVTFFGYNFTSCLGYDKQGKVEDRKKTIFTRSYLINKHI
jgi:hypothetical protein